MSTTAAPPKQKHHSKKPAASDASSATPAAAPAPAPKHHHNHHKKAAKPTPIVEEPTDAPAAAESAPIDSADDVSFKAAPAKPSLEATPQEASHALFDHVTSYPLIDGALGLATSVLSGFPLVSFFAGYLSLAVNLFLGAVNYFPLTVYVYNLLDYYLNLLLVLLDDRFPALANFGWDDVKDYAGALVSYIETTVLGYKDDAVKAAQSKVDPLVKKGIQKGSDLYNSALDTKLPGGKTVGAVAENLIDRSEEAHTIATDTAKKLEPYLQQARELPQYVIDVFNQERVNANGNVQEALSKTAAKLGDEAYVQLKPVVDRIVNATEQAEFEASEDIAGAAAKSDGLSGQAVGPQGVTVSL